MFTVTWNCDSVYVLQEWVVLGQVDLEMLVEKHLNSVDDWERNFKALKARGKESERLPRYKLHTTNTHKQCLNFLDMSYFHKTHNNCKTVGIKHNTNSTKIISLS